MGKRELSMKNTLIKILNIILSVISVTNFFLLQTLNAIKAKQAKNNGLALKNWGRLYI
jgi:hypothetical protein